MMPRTPRAVAAPAVAATVVLALTACVDSIDPAPTDVPAPSLDRGGVSGIVVGLGPDLAALRALTAPFHRLEAAQAAGWSAELTPCLELPGVGGMGYHWGNPALIDGSVNELEPEVLVYPLRPDGTLRLGAVEYIVPLDAWEADDPPELFGIPFHVNEGAGLWVLHVWIGQHNPTGLFQDWNPRVGC